MDVLRDAVGTVAATGCGLIAGLFFAFSVAVMPALGRVPAPAGIAAMQSVNAVIVRPLFLVPFLGTAVTCAAAAALIPDPRHIAAAVLYAVGVVGVTAAANVPLNNALDTRAADGAQTARFWRRYLTRWTAWNHVRTVAGTAATLALAG